MLATLDNVIQANHISHGFKMEGDYVPLFEDVDLAIEQGKSYAIKGPSGSGKSSLLMLLSGLEQPTKGTIQFAQNGSLDDIAHLRSDIGFIFQQFHLLPELSALSNVALPLRLRGVKDAISLATNWLEKVGLAHRLNHKPNQLSGGEQQRVAIARALVFSPKFIFADEPLSH